MRKSTILLVIPKMEKFSRSRELGVEQSIAWSRIADCGGCDKGWPVRTLTQVYGMKTQRTVTHTVRFEHIVWGFETFKINDFTITMFASALAILFLRYLAVILYTVTRRLKLKSSKATYPTILTSNYWFVTQRMNMR